MTRKLSAKNLTVKGIMLDPARLTERHEFYFDLLPKLAEWGFNTLWWHFVDDEGFVLKLDAHPELATPYAFSKAETRRFIAEAGKHGIEVVPEVESLGHGRYITRLPQYAHLHDGITSGFNAICPSHRDTIPLLREIIEEVADLFPSEYFHAGLDEVNLAGCKRCARRAKGKAKWRIYADHVKAIHKIVTGCDKRMMMWADHVQRSPAMLRELPSDIVMIHWHYGKIDTDAISRSLDAGFEVIGAPAMMRHRHVIQPHKLNIQNTEDMIDTASKLTGRGMLGVVNTWWTPRRVLRDACLPVAAYTGHLLNGGSKDKVAFFAKHLREQFGLLGTKAARALWTFHQDTLVLSELQALAFDSPADMLDAVAMSAHNDIPARIRRISQAVDTLAAASKKVTRNHKAYKACILAGRLAAELLANSLDLAKAYTIYKQAENLFDRGYPKADVAKPLDEAAGVLGLIHKRLDTLSCQVSDEWDRTRYPRDVKKAVTNLAEPCPMDSLLGRLVRSRAFVQTITAKLKRATEALRHGGHFPTAV